MVSHASFENGALLQAGSDDSDKASKGVETPESGESGRSLIVLSVRCVLFFTHVSTLAVNQARRMRSISVSANSCAIRLSWTVVVHRKQ
jgi:hypothetical protein